MSTLKVIKSYKLLIILLALNSCMPGPNYQKPSLSLPGKWSVLPPKPENQNQPRARNPFWWHNFNDPLLNELINIANQTNFDLQIAKSKVIEARADLRQSKSQFFPQVNLSGSALYSNSGNNFILGLDASWELDLFGAVRRADEAGQAILESQDAALQIVLISLKAEVARNYMELRYLQNQVSLTEKTLASWQALEQLEKAKNKAGLSSLLEVIQIQSSRLAMQSELSNLKSQLNATRLRIEFLLSKEPGGLAELLDSKSDLPNYLGEPLINSPLSVICNRPDIKQAERELAAATALEGVAVASLYPSISLGSFFGFESVNLSNLLKPYSRSRWVQPTISLPLIDFGKIRSTIKIMNARKEQALLAYQKIVLNALGEVENNLVSYLNNQQNYGYLAKNLEITQKALKLTRDKYNQGLISRADLLRNELVFYQASSQLAAAHNDLNNSLISLYKALGSKEVN